VIGGLLLEHYAWGTVFLINLPVVLLAMLATLLLVPRRPAAGGASWDLIGSVQVMSGLFGLVYAIKACAQRPFSLLALLGGLLVAAVFLTLFARRQRGRPQPLIDFTLFRLPGFTAAVAGAGLGTAGIVGFELVLGQQLQLVLGLSPLQAGLIILPAPLGSFLAGPVTGRLLRYASAHRVGAGGLLLSAAAALCLLPLSFEQGLTLPLTTLLVLIGAGVGAAATAASSAIMSSAPPERSGMAASIEEVAFELGSALGVALFGSLMTIAYAASLATPDLPAAASATVHESLDDALRIAASLPEPVDELLRSQARAAFTGAFHAVIAGAALLWALSAFGMRYQKRL
jgi:DHA2 family multidrug resistance protein-like MFS transporter